MEKKYKSYKIKMIIMSVAFFLMSASLFLMSITDYDRSGAMKVLAYATTLMLYIGFIVGVVFLIILTVSRKKENSEIKGLPGVLRFFGNKAAIVADIAFIVGVIAVIVTRFEFTTSAVDFRLYSYTLLTFVIHSTLNGKNFAYMTTLKDGESKAE